MSIPNQITIESNNPTEIAITQPVTRILQVTTPGPQGPAGPVGPSGNDSFFITTGSVSASVALTGDIFTVSSASTDIFSINYQGVAILQETITDPDPIRGGIFFSTTGDFYFGS